MEAVTAEAEAWITFKRHELQCTACFNRARKSLGNCLQGSELRSVWAREASVTRRRIEAGSIGKILTDVIWAEEDFARGGGS